MHILAVPNDDGFGPAALLSYLVKALLQAEPRARLTIWNDFAFDFNRYLYRREFPEGRVRVERVWNLIQLGRENGAISLTKSLERMGEYARASEMYGKGTFDLVLDFGVPAAAAWARRAGIPSVTVFDHSWSKSLAMIGGTHAPEEWRRLVAAVASDERQAERVLLFPEFIAPPVFRSHWESLIGTGRVSAFEGVLCEPGTPAREEARKLLGLRHPGPVMLVQGGGTSVWNPPLRRLARQLLDPAGRERLSKERINLVVWFPRGALSMEEAVAFNRLQRVRRLTLPDGGTIQKILPAIDYLILRAGGGSVNDAIAHRKPFVCVREPGQLQIEAILAECSRRELTWPVDIEGFRGDPLGVILAQYRLMRARRDALIERLGAIPNTAAESVAQQILALVG